MPRVRSVLRAPVAAAYWLGAAQARAAENGADRIFLCHGTPRGHAARLERQLRYLQRAFTIVPLAEFAASLPRARAPGARRRAALTFDDGLRSNLLVAYPILRALGVPATFFVCPGLIEERRWLWTHEARCRLQFAGPQVRQELAAELRAPAEVDAFVERMKQLDLPQRKRVEARLREASAGFAPSESEREAFDLAGWRELRSLDPSIVTVGSHSMTHPVLPSMSLEEIDAELRDSRGMIEAKLARPAEFFSYPNGDVDERTLAGVRRYYRAAVRYGSASGPDPHLMPSVHLPRGVLALAWDERVDGVVVMPSRHTAKTNREAFDIQTAAFVLGMNETGLTAVRCLGREGISVKGFDTDARRAAFRSRYCSAEVCPDPLHQPDELVQFLTRQVGDGWQKVVLLPTSDLFFLFLSRHRAQLADKFLMNLPAEAVAESVVNKRTLYELAAANGTPFPKSCYPGTYDEALAVKDSLRYPAFIKPYWGHQWRRHFGGAHKGFKVRSPDEFLARFREVLDSGHSALVQSYVTSADDNLFSLSLYVSRAGEVLAAFPRKQVRQYPPNSGTVSLAISERNAKLVANGTRFCRSIGYRGIAGLEYKLDREDNQYKLLDFNPRLMLSDSLTAYCGINLPLMQYQDLTCQTPAARREYPEGVKWLDSMKDFHSFKQYHERGELGFKDWLNSLKGARVFALFAWDDPLPFLIERRFGLSYGRIAQYAIKHFLHRKLRAAGRTPATPRPAWD